MSTINPKAFKRTPKQKLRDSTKDGDTKTIKGERFKQVAGKWKKIKKSPGKIVDRSRNTAYGQEVCRWQLNQMI